MYSLIPHRLLGTVKGESISACCHLDSPCHWALVLRLIATVLHNAAPMIFPTQSIIYPISSVNFLQSIRPQNPPDPFTCGNSI